ncbi:hypothetical protein H0G86_006014 [Trichoderma simmonsii]|uniref:Uncharacterized protein n=1 Tax=Trichoderma simmonsii TaxID=1491479 RepID=A0A8G0LAN9_9HYPO|nr:hypothetical protein H0G86_006014 [Trichoderma simmonsii]
MGTNVRLLSGGSAPCHDPLKTKPRQIDASSSLSLLSHTLFFLLPFPCPLCPLRGNRSSGELDDTADISTLSFGSCSSFDLYLAFGLPLTSAFSKTPRSERWPQANSHDTSLFPSFLLSSNLLNLILPNSHPDLPGSVACSSDTSPLRHHREVGAYFETTLPVTQVPQLRIPTNV